VTLAFTKGHGTGNDFVIVPDPAGDLKLTPADVAALCDRRRGIGGDGLLRVVRTAAEPEVAHRSAEAEWFMDYRNGDGSLADMCGNGARVFARYLVESGLTTGPRVRILTRAGVVTAEVGDASVAVTMPLPVVGGPGSAKLAGTAYEGTTAACGNPNLVCPVSSLDDLDLSATPEFGPASLPDRANVEFIVPVGPDHVRMRVIERGVGETLSCGSGACAVAGVVLAGRDGSVTIDVPGGRLTVTIAGGGCVLAGPAVLVASGTTSMLSPE
jgi:diaminopimelate epimerase